MPSLMLDVSSIKKSDKKITVQHHKDDHGVWIGTKEDLVQLNVRITEGQESGEIQEITLDLEVHSHCTFTGFVCMIQLSMHCPPTPPPTVLNNNL